MLRTGGSFAAGFEPPKKSKGILGWVGSGGCAKEGRTYRIARMRGSHKGLPLPPAIVGGEFVDALAIVVDGGPGDFADPFRFGKDQLPEAEGADATGVLVAVRPEIVDLFEVVEETDAEFEAAFLASLWLVFTLRGVAGHEGRNFGFLDGIIEPGRLCVCPGFG